jgi:hypothetical protein
MGDMAFCSCSSPSPTQLIAVYEDGFPPGDERHQICYGSIGVTLCSQCGAAQIERLDHDCFDYEEVYDQYQWYRLEETKALREFVSGCTKPEDPQCKCNVHVQLREQCSRLPRPSWSFGLEHQNHVFKVSFEKGKLSVV